MEQLLRGREEITSAEVCATLTADPTSEWCDFRGKGPIVKLNSPLCSGRTGFTRFSCIRERARLSRGAV